MPSLRINTNLNPEFVFPFLQPCHFFDKFKDDQKKDCNVLPDQLHLGIAQKDGWKKAGSIGDVFTWVIDPISNTATICSSDGKHKYLQDISLVQRAQLSKWVLANTAQISPLVVATLGIFKSDLKKGEMILPEHVNRDANERILRNVYLSGWGNAENLNSQLNPDLTGYARPAVMMDTWGRTPALMTNEMITSEIDWHAQFGRNNWEMLIGTGSEGLPVEKRKAGALNDINLWGKYIQARKAQLKQVKDSGHIPILFPDTMHNGLRNEENIALVKELLETYPHEIVAHILGTPFVPETDWYNEKVLKATAGLARYVKTSTPYYDAQVKYYDTIQEAGSFMLTGDDRNWPLVLALGAKMQLEKRKRTREVDKIVERAGYQFIEDHNVGALLGYLGLNLHQTIAAVHELSIWYKLMLNDKEALADKHLQRFFELTVPAMGMSTDVFFGPMNPTSAYTSYVRMANIITGVIKPQDGNVLLHRRSIWEDTYEQKFINGRLLCWMLLCGAITPEETVTVIEKYPDLFDASIERN